MLYIHFKHLKMLDVQMQYFQMENIWEIFKDKCFFL